MAESDPPEPLAPGVPFAAWLLTSLDMKEHIIACGRGGIVRVYQMFPIYREEYEYERRHGVGALLERLAAHDVQDYIDLDRPNTCRT